MAPLISVVIPFFNPGNRLAKAVESARTNGYENLEIILVDDGSSEPVEEFSGVTTLRQSNQGPAAARNVGWRQARGDFLAFLDADDLWKRGSLELLARLLLENPDAQIAQGKMERVLLAGPTHER